MHFFQKNKKGTGWMVVCLQQNNFYVASIKRAPSVKPVVEFAQCYATDASSHAATLAKIGRESRTEHCELIHLLAANEYQILSVEAPNVPVDELKTAIRWRLKDMLDFHIDDATIDVLDVPLDKSAANRNHAMYAVVARNQLIEQRQTLFSEAKISLGVIDIPEMAQRNIATLLEPAERGLALLSFDVDGGLLTMSFGGELYLSRRIDVTLAQLAQSDEEQKAACYERVTLELQRSLDHFERQYHHIALAKLVLAPLGNTVSGLDAYLAEHLYVSVELLNLEKILDFASLPELKSADLQQRYFMTLGAALRVEETVL